MRTGTACTPISDMPAYQIRSTNTILCNIVNMICQKEIIRHQVSDVSPCAPL
jgi:hypothetical protein